MPCYGNNSKRNQRLLRGAEIGENDHLSRANFRRPNDDLCAMNCICGGIRIRIRGVGDLKCESS
jgi:hypothetical protein